jgi:hypothetical protein
VNPKSAARQREIMTKVFCCLAVVALASAGAQTVPLDPSRRLDTTSQVAAAPGVRESAMLDSNRLDDPIEFAAASPGDSDLGEQLIFKETPKQRPFSATADSFLFWTDNAANTPFAPQADWFWGAQVAAGWQPRIGRRLFLNADINQQLFRYDRFEVLDFELFQTSANLFYLEPRLGDLILFAGPHFQRMTVNDFGDALFNSVSLRAGAQKIFLLNRRNSIQTAVMADWDLETDLDQVFRHEYSGDVGWQLKIMRDLVLTTSYRFVWFDYTRVDRRDALSLVNANLGWRPRRWLEVYLTANWAYNDSNLDFFDYETATVGAGLGVRARF